MFQARIIIVRAKRNGLLVRTRTQKMVLGSFPCCLLVIQQLGRWTQKIRANVDHCRVCRREETRRVHCARPRTQAPEPALTDSSLAARRLASRVFLYNQAYKPSTMTDCCCLMGMYSRMIRIIATKDARWVRCSCCSLSFKTVYITLPHTPRPIFHGRYSISPQLE